MSPVCWQERKGEDERGLEGARESEGGWERIRRGAWVEAKGREKRNKPRDGRMTRGEEGRGDDKRGWMRGDRRRDGMEQRL